MIVISLARAVVTRLYEWSKKPEVPLAKPSGVYEEVTAVVFNNGECYRACAVIPADLEQREQIEIAVQCWVLSMEMAGQ